ncbi:MAG: hypothetical protein WCP86_09710, partial [bacterium]
MDRGHQQAPQPNRRSQTIWLWVAFILLAVLIGCLAYLLIQGLTERPGKAAPPAGPPTATAGQWGDRY